MKKIVQFFLLLGMVAYMSGVASQGYAIGFGEPLVDAAEAGDKDKVSELLDAGHSVDKAGEFGTTALMRASVRGDSSLVNTLLNAGAVVNIADIGGETALHLAARKGHSKVLKQLISSDAKIDATDKEGWTPLMRAVMSGKQEATEILVKAGADITKENTAGVSALGYAVKGDKLAFLKILASSSGVKNISDVTKKSILELAQKKHNDALDAQLATMFSTPKLVVAEQEPSEMNEDTTADTADSAPEFKDRRKKIGQLEPSISVRDASKVNGSYESITSSVLRKFKNKKEETAQNTIDIEPKATHIKGKARDVNISRLEELNVTPSSATEDAVVAAPVKTMTKDFVAATNAPKLAAPQAIAPKIEEKTPDIAAVAKEKQLSSEIEAKEKIADNVSAKEISVSKEDSIPSPKPVLKAENKRLFFATKKPPLEKQVAEKEIKELPWQKEKIVTAKAKQETVEESTNKNAQIAVAAPPAVASKPGMSYPVSWVPIKPLVVKAPPKNLLIAASETIPQTLFVIQLGVFSSKEEAANTWYSLRAKYENILGNVVPVVKRVTLAKDNKTLFRLRAGSFSERDKAEALCSALSDKNVECFVVDKANEMRGSLSTKAKMVNAAPPLVDTKQLSDVRPSLPDEKAQAKIAQAEKQVEDKVDKQSQLVNKEPPLPEIITQVPEKPTSKPSVIAQSSPVQTPISLAPVNTTNDVVVSSAPAAIETPKNAKPIEITAANVNVRNDDKKPAIAEEVTVKIDQTLPWLNTSMQTPIPVKEIATPVKVEVITPPAAQVAAPVVIAPPAIEITAKEPEVIKQAAKTEVAKAEVIAPAPKAEAKIIPAPVQISAPVATAQIVTKEEPASYSTTIEEMPWQQAKASPATTSISAIPVAATASAPNLPKPQAIEKQTQAVLANRQALSQIPLNDFETEYSEFDKALKQQAGQFKHSSVSEAVMVRDDGYYSSSQTDNLAIKTGNWYKIGAFDNKQQAEDYYNRMFKFNADLTTVSMEIVPHSKGFIQNKIALQVGPVSSTQANLVCQMALQNKLECNSVSSDKTPAMAKLAPGRRPINKDMMPTGQAIANAQKWIQLGTFSNRSEAEYYWMYLQEDHQQSLRGLRPDLQQVVHGSFGGQAVGLKAGPFSSEDQAMQVCRSLSSQKVACALASN